MTTKGVIESLQEGIRRYYRYDEDKLGMYIVDIQILIKKLESIKPIPIAEMFSSVADGEIAKVRYTELARKWNKLVEEEVE